MESSSQDRNLPASERKLEKAREDGQVTRSKDLSNIAVLGVGSVGVLSLSPLLFGQLKTQISQQLSFDARVMATPTSYRTEKARRIATASIFYCCVST